MKTVTHDMLVKEVGEYLVADNPTILEIGCNDGTDTNLFLSLYPTAQVYCFEPDPRAIARYHKTVSHPNAHLVEIALSDKGGLATFYGSSGQPKSRQNHYCRLDEWDLSGSLCQPTGHLKMSPWVTFPEDRQFQVETMRLDDWVAQTPGVGVIDFIWMDVQGAEALVIRGAKEALLGVRYFYTEYYDTPMYEGQPNLEQITAMLPGFALVATYGTTNALFRNATL